VSRQLWGGTCVALADLKYACANSLVCFVNEVPERYIKEPRSWVMSLEYRVEILIKLMCGNMDESTLKAVILATIPEWDKWRLSYDPPLRLPVTDGDDLYFGDRESGHIDALDQIRRAVSTRVPGDIERADDNVGYVPNGPVFYMIILHLYFKWRNHQPSGVSDTDSTSGSVYSENDFDMGIHAKLHALRMSMRK
jgi:hypothetical protein